MSDFTLSGGRMTRVIVSLSTAVLLSGAGMVIPQIASAITVAEIQAQIAVLTAQLNALIAQQGGAAAPTGKCSFTRDLSQGSRGDDVICLQKYLNSSGNEVSAIGAGSPGNETTFFGPKTRAAVSKWQAANGVSPTAGYFGPRSRAKYDSLVAGAPSAPAAPAAPGTPAAAPAVPSGSGLTVSSATQPGDSLAPLNASRVPATAFTVTASADGDTRVNSVTVERQGPAADASVSSVVLLGDDGLQIGLSKTLNSNHQAILNTAFTVKAGTSKTYSIAINRPATGSDGGNILKMAVVAVDAGSATVSGSLPIVGSPLTMNSTLTIGTFASAQKGVNDPGSAQTKEIGTKGYTFTAIRFTAGSAEDVSVKWISFNQSGSAGATDLKNFVINAGGTDYPSTVSDDGKYYTAKFGDGITVAKGNNLEFYVKGDIEGGSNRTVIFDLYRFTDLFAVGRQFGYGITPSGGTTGTASAGSFSSDTNPAWKAYTGTIGNGTMTVTASTAIAAQNVAVNLSGQPLGAFDVEVKGEPITVASMVIRVSGNKNVASVTEVDYSQVALHDNTTGKVVAGPLDGSGTADSQMIFTFTDSVTFPIGKRAYVLKGKLSTDFTSDVLVSASTTPNSDWTSATGQVSGASITPANTGTVSGNSMTVKAGAVNVSLSNTPTGQTVIRGATGLTFANIVFDAANSGEDIRFTSVGVQHNYAVAADLTNCRLFDGTTALNTGTNIVNPAAAASASLKDNTFTLDNNLTVLKGTAKTIALNCDISKSGTGAYAQWTFSSNETFGATGLTSGNSITPSVASSSVTNLMVLSGAGTLAVTLDPSSPSVRLAQSGQEVTVSAIRFTATNEDVTLTQVALLMSGTASSSASDIVKYTLWDGAAKVGEVSATSSTSGVIISTGTCTGCSPLTVSKDTDKIVTVKAQLANIGTNQIGRPGHLVIINWDSVVLNGNNATYGVGVQSTSNVYATGSDTASAGVRTVRAYPTITVLPLPSTTLSNGAQTLYRFSVSAPAGTNGVSLYKVSFNIASTAPSGSSTPINSLTLYAWTSSGFSGGAYSSNGQLNNGSVFNEAESGNSGININDAKATTSDYAFYFNPVAPASVAGGQEAIAIPAGQTYYFELKGTVNGAVTGSSVTTVLEGDRSWFPATCGGAGATCDNTGFVAGAINYSFATSAPFVDQAHDNSGGVTVSGGQSGVVTASQTWTDQRGAGANFIWSGNSTTTRSGTAGAMGPDWTNGFVVPGLPSNGAVPQTLTK